MADTVDEAVRAAHQIPLKMITAEVKLCGNPARPAALVLPADITDLEQLALVQALIGVGDELRSKRPSSRLVLP